MNELRPVLFVLEPEPGRLLYSGLLWERDLPGPGSYQRYFVNSQKRIREV